MILLRMWSKASHICTYTIRLKSPKTSLLTQFSYIGGELTNNKSLELRLPDKLLCFKAYCAEVGRGNCECS